MRVKTGGNWTPEAEIECSVCGNSTKGFLLAGYPVQVVSFGGPPRCDVCRAAAMRFSLTYDQLRQQYAVKPLLERMRAATVSREQSGKATR